MNRSAEPATVDNSSVMPSRTPEPTWCIASAAAHGMTGLLNPLTKYTPMSGELVVHPLGCMQVPGSGSVNTANITLQDVWYVPGLDANLVSTKLGHRVSFDPYGCRINKDSEDGALISSACSTTCSTENLALHHGSDSAHPDAFGDIEHIMKKHSRSSVPTDLVEKLIEVLLDCTSGGHVATQPVEKTELACYLRSGGPVTSGGNIFPIRTAGGNDTNIPLLRRLFSFFFKGSGTTSAPGTIPGYVIDIIEPRWIVDSGAGASLTGDWSLLEGVHPAEVMWFIVANGERVMSCYCGRACGRVNLSGIRYAPGCNQNIISASHLVGLGCEVTFNDQGCTIKKNGILIGKAPPATEPEGLYYLDYLRDAQLGSICSACPHPRAQGN